MIKTTAAIALIGALLMVGPAKAQPGRQLEYNLPATAANVRVELALISCSDEGIRAVPTVTVVPTAGSSIETQNLIVTRPPWYQKRELTVELFDNGTIKSLNGGAADQTLDMVASAVKIAVALAPMLAAPPPFAVAPPSRTCSQVAIDALAQVTALEARITTLRNELVTAPSGEFEDRQIQLTALAGEVARLKTGPLTLVLEEKIKFDRSTGVLRWTGDDLRKWLALPELERPYDLFQIQYCARLAGEAASACASSTDRRQAIPICTFNCVLIPDPAESVLILTSTAESGFYRSDRSPFPAGSTLSRADLPIPQWGSYTPTYFEARFAEQWTTGMTFDAFGRLRSLASTSNARGASILTAAQSVATDLNAAARTARTDSLAAVTSRTADLTARMELNRLRYCQAVIEAGGFVCPTAPAAPVVVQ